MRDGEVVLYLRPTSRVWQVRYKLFDRKWRCVSTKQRQLEFAKRVAGELYDKARFREEEGLPQKSVRFGTLANECIRVLKVEIDRGIRPNTNMDYIRAMNNYLIPFFGKLMLTNITAQKVAEYEAWRNQTKHRLSPLRLSGGLKSRRPFCQQLYRHAMRSQQTASDTP